MVRCSALLSAAVSFESKCCDARAGVWAVPLPVLFSSSAPPSGTFVRPPRPLCPRDVSAAASAVPFSPGAGHCR